MTDYTYRGTAKNDPLPSTCGDKIGTLTGVTRHRRANERPCRRCQKAAREYHTERGRLPEVAARRHQGQAARKRALQMLAKAHPEELRRIYLEVLQQVNP